MMWSFGPGGATFAMWALGTLTMLVLWGGLAALIVWAVTVRARPGGGRESAEEILKRRLAAGEISQEDYEKTRKALGI